MALIQKITGNYPGGEPFPLRVLVADHHVEGGRGAPDVTAQIEIDAESNAQLLADMAQNAKDYDLSAGVLTKKGQAVTIADDGKRLVALKAVRQYVQDIDSGAITALTGAQRIDRLERAVALLLRDAYRERLR